MCPPADSVRSPLTRGHKAKLDNSKIAKLEPHKLAQTFEQRWVRVDDVEYDVTNFKHPGGSVIFYMLSNTGADATEAFKEFHMRSRFPSSSFPGCPGMPHSVPKTFTVRTLEKKLGHRGRSL